MFGGKVPLFPEEQGKNRRPSGTPAVASLRTCLSLCPFPFALTCDDGLVDWNFFDAYLETGKTFPVYKLMQNVNAVQNSGDYLS